MMNGWRAVSDLLSVNWSSSALLMSRLKSCTVAESPSDSPCQRSQACTSADRPRIPTCSSRRREAVLRSAASAAQEADQT